MRAVAGILVLGFALLGGPIASGELPTPCRSWIFPCGEGQHRCTTEQQYQSFVSGPQPGCPVFYNPNATAPPGECVLINGACNFTENTVNCTTWLPGCEYRCGTFEEYEENPSDSCPNLEPVPLPDALCIPINDSCQWYNPCRLRRSFCNLSYQCGTLSEYWAMVYGPQPLCSPPAPGWEEPETPGECILQQGECTWSGEFVLRSHNTTMKSNPTDDNYCPTMIPIKASSWNILPATKVTPLPANHSQVHVLETSHALAS